MHIVFPECSFLVSSITGITSSVPAPSPRPFHGYPPEAALGAGDGAVIVADRVVEMQGWFFIEDIIDPQRDLCAAQPRLTRCRISRTHVNNTIGFLIATDHVVIATARGVRHRRPVVPGVTRPVE